MTLGQKQRKFVGMLGRLYVWMYANGYECSLGRGFVSAEENERVGGHPKSNHLHGLAQDINLFKDGEYLTDGTGHVEMHDYWDLIGGAARIGKDLNHYSIKHNGIR
jgi:hypothetical protein